MPVRSQTTLRAAWKESQAVVRAMGDGKHFLLLTRDAAPAQDVEGRLVLEHLEFFLFPDLANSGREQIRPEFHSYLEGASDHDGGNVTLRYRVVVTEGLMVMEGTQLLGLSSFHTWTDEHVRRTSRWDPQDPAFLLTCKVQRLDPPLVIPARESYGGPGAWIRIEDGDLGPVSFESVLDHKDYLKVVVDVKAALAEVQKNPMPKPEPAAAAPEAAAKPAGA